VSLVYNVNMKTSIIDYKGRYGFHIEGSNNKLLFSSLRDYYVIPSIKSSYKYAWQACSALSKFIRKRPYHVAALEDMGDRVMEDISAEERLTSHYLKVYEGMASIARSSKGSKKEEDRAYQQINMVSTELQSIEDALEERQEKRKFKKLRLKFEKLREKFFPGRKKKEDAIAKAEEASAPPIPSMSPPMPDQGGGMPPIMASSFLSDVDEEAIEDLLENYAEDACEAIQDYHHGIMYIVDYPIIRIYDKCGKDENLILKIFISDKFNVSNIIPVGNLSRLYPLHSVKFYQRYWKPIVEAVGHFFVASENILICPNKQELPDIPRGNHRFSLEGWNSKGYKLDNVDLSFEGEKPIWFFEGSKNKTSSSQRRIVSNYNSKYTEQDYLNAIVRCIDPQLKSIYQRTGEVIQVIPHEDFIEVDVDFGRGLGIQRLTEDRLEIVLV